MESGFSLAFIGCGHMGGAILKGVLAEGNRTANDILVVEKSAGRLEEWAELGVTTTERAADARSVSRILLAVKPQDFPSAAAELEPLPESTLVISVMAGLSSTAIQVALGNNARVVRAMPNTPCQIGVGITAIAPGIGATPEDLQFANELLSTVGAVVGVEEKHMHAVTATSGSGPAYAFLLAEAWLAAAIKQGLDAEVARRLVHETLAGAAALLAANPDAAALRKAVTSKGGTTAAALDRLEEHGFRTAMEKAVEAATDRGRELDSEVPS
jgi:pyrroline-5-carboxylate reductase